MSSISFPHSAHTHSGSTSAAQGDQFYAPFDANSSYQMNPLSSHPPRTPRTSIASSSTHIYGSSIYESNEERQEVYEATDEIDEEDEKVKEMEGRVRKEEVWREMFLTSNGRDKAFKLMQYSIRVYLLFHTSLTTTTFLRRPASSPLEIEILKRLNSTASGLSFSRKLLLLFNWLQPLTEIMAQQSVPYSSELSAEVKSKKVSKSFLYSVLHASPQVLLNFVNAIADDVATFSKLGLLGPRTGDRAGRFADWCWLLATLAGLVENGFERQMIGDLRRTVEARLYTESMSGATAKSRPTASKIDEKELARLQKQDYWLQITRAKLLMDLTFVSYDVFKIKRGKEPVKIFTGLAAAILSSAKLYDRHKSTLVKALRADK